MTTNPFDLLDAEAARLDRFFGTLTGPDWLIPSRCPGWNRKDMLAHLSGIEDYIRAGLDDRVEEYAEQAGPGVDYQRLNEFLVAQRSDTDAATLLRLWRQQVAELHPRLRERGVSGTIATHAGSYPAGRQSYFFATELAIHADDIAVPIGDDERQDRLSWRLEFALDVLAEYAKSVTISGSGDEYTVTVNGLSATLSRATLVEATAGRLPSGRLPAELQDALVVLA